MLNKGSNFVTMATSVGVGSSFSPTACRGGQFVSRADTFHPAVYPAPKLSF